MKLPETPYAPSSVAVQLAEAVLTYLTLEELAESPTLSDGDALEVRIACDTERDRLKLACAGILAIADPTSHPLETLETVE